MRIATRFLIAVALAPAFAAPANGQVYRKNVGQALDSNYQIGSGGYNTVVGGEGGVNTQLIVTGQVTGLAGFRGNVGYRPSNELGLDVPSATLSDFRRQSVNVSDVLTGQTYKSRSYFAPSRTSVQAYSIEQNLNQPGTSKPLTRFTTPRFARKFYDEATEEYRPLTAVDLAPEVPMPREPIVAEDGAVVRTRDDEPGSEFVERYDEPGPGALFGMLRRTERLELANELYRLGRNDRRLDARLEGPQQDPAQREEDQRDPRLRDVNRPLGAEDLRRTAPERRGEPVRPNEDVYTDLLVRMHQQRSGRGQPTEFGVERDTAELIEAWEKPSGRKQEKIVEYSKQRGQVVLRGLAGKGKDLFNRYMNQGEARLRDGKYYDAYGRYQLAATVNPRNPLARLGAGLALFGAGEPLSAGYQVRQAMELFPPIMETRLTTAKLLSEKRIAQRLSQIRRRLERKDKTEPLLALAGAYFSLNSGQQDQAKEFARAIQASGSDDKLTKAFAAYVLTGKSPRLREKASAEN